MRAAHLGLGTIWTSEAQIMFIDFSAKKPQWTVLAKCVDTPNAIKAALAKVQVAHPTKTLWVQSPARGSRYIP